jgi:hypothetical protein
MQKVYNYQNYNWEWMLLRAIVDDNNVDTMAVEVVAGGMMQHDFVLSSIHELV